ncbi:MAG: HDOD domain-containing protein [Candidatus Latescibacteria bacterium]|nr:HDOD domain-containing protein [Candidatus Latescibacterota bacterium]
MKKILFVDDELNVLLALRRMLRSMRHEWEMEFATSGKEALEMLAKSHVDVIVTDMRMPNISGVELLNEVKKQYPHIIRIILSGQADEEAIMRSVGPIHQYLAKPCDPEMLKSVLTRAFSLRDLLADEKIKQLVSQMESLPSLPSLYHELMNELQSPNISFKSVAKIISQDIGMSSKILQLVNSAFFGVSQHVSSPEQAVGLLGLDVIRSLVLSVQVFKQFDSIALEGISLDAIWEHSRMVSLFAKRIAEVENTDSRTKDYAYVAGLLHDVGKLVLIANMPVEYELIFKKVVEEKITLTEGEIEIFGVSHEKIGAYLMGLWGFADPVIEALAFHHNPMQFFAKGFSPLTAVYVANVLEHHMYPERSMSYLQNVDLSYLEKLGLSEKLSKWQELCEKTIKEEVVE